MSEVESYKQDIKNPKGYYMINYCYKIDKDGAHKKWLKLTCFDLFYNVEPAAEEDKDTTIDPPLYFDQKFPYTWIPHDIWLQAYREDIESWKLIYEIGKKEYIDVKTKQAYYNPHGLYLHKIHMDVAQQESRRVVEANTITSLPDADLSNLPSTIQDLTVVISQGTNNEL